AGARAMLARCGTLALGAAAGTSLFMLAAAARTGRMEAGLEAVGLGLVAAVGLAARWLPDWVERSLLAAALAVTATYAVAWTPREVTVGAPVGAVAVLTLVALVAR